MTLPIDASPLRPVIVVACEPAWQAILEAEGFSVVWCDGPEDAVAALDRRRGVALISGVSAAPQLRQARRTVPWVVVAEQADDDLLDALEDGADDFVLTSTESGLFGLRLRALLRLVGQMPAVRDGGVPAAATAASRPATDSRERVLAQGTLLTWAAYFIVEHVCARLGTNVTECILRRTREHVLRRRPALACFRIANNARVEMDAGEAARAGEGAVAAVSEWLATVLEQAGDVRPGTGEIDVRAATALMEGPLEQVGFYAAFEAARLVAAANIVSRRPTTPRADPPVREVLAAS